MVLQIILALTVILYLIYYYSTRTFNYWKTKNVRGPVPIPFFGNIKDSALRRVPFGRVLRECYESYPEEKVVAFYRMTSPSLLIRDPEIIKPIMIKDFDIFCERGVRYSQKGLGKNLVHADEDTWRALRNKLTPLFTSGKLKNMLYLLNERGVKFVEYVDEICHKETEQNIISLLQKYTVATIAACAFGIELNYVKEQNIHELQRTDEAIFNISYVQELEFLYPGLLYALGLSFFPRKLTEFFMKLVNSVIAQRNGKPSNRKDFMDLLLELRQNGNIQSIKRNANEKGYELELSDSVIAAQAFVFYAGGYETSAALMGYLLYELALNPDVQNKLVTEIETILEKHNGNVTYEAITGMSYMDQVFEETLRMHPPVDRLQRQAKTNYKLPGTEVVIEKGYTILISITGIHNDSKYYVNPEQFDPERFAPGNNVNRHPCTFIPFGVGPRNCIGFRFALIQSRVCLIHLLRKYKVECSKNTTMLENLRYNPYRFTLTPTEGILLNLLPRRT